MAHTVLLVDDDPHVLEGLTRLLRKESYKILTAGSAEEGARLLASHPIDLIVCDEQMPGMSGTEFLAKVARDYPDTVRIVLTGHPSLPAALRAVNEGRVYQFFTKPCNEIDLALAIRRALEEKDLLAKSRDLLEVTKRQAVLIDEARILRRLHDMPRRARARVLAKGEGAVDRRELLDQIDEEIRKGKELLACLKRSAYPECDAASPQCQEESARASP